MALSALCTLWPLLRLAGVLLSIATLAMLSALFPVIRNKYIFYGDGLEEVYNGLPLGGNCYTIIYSGAALLMLLISGSPWHPGIDIALDFIAWGLNWSFGVLLLIWVSYNDVDIYCDRPPQYYDEQDCSETRAVTGVQYTGGILTVVVGCMHAAHFVKACIDTHHRRISDKRAHFMELGGVRPT